MYNSTQPQNVLDTPNISALFLTYTFKNAAGKKFDLATNRAELRAKFAQLCGKVININEEALENEEYKKDQCSIVLAISWEAWSKLGLGKERPQQLLTFPGFTVGEHSAPGTGGDLHIHIRGNQSFNVDAAQEIRDILKDIADCQDSVQSFSYHKERSILGFVDGTENPQGEEKEEFGLIGDEDPLFKNGSYVFTQKYIHDMDKWRALSVEEQEAVIGRTKKDDIEFDDDKKAKNAHVAVANIGSDHRVIRANLPFGNPATGEMGTYFISYSRYFKDVSLMLQAMFFGTNTGEQDAILNFSKAVTGALFFAPSKGMLKEWSQLQ